MDERFSDMLKFGINLKLSGPNENKYYTQRLVHFIMSKEDFDADTEDDSSISVYVKSELALMVHVRNSILKFEPVTEASYDGIMVVLDFVANLHNLVQEDYKKEGFIENEFKSQKKQEAPEDSEDHRPEDDSDDMEWI